LGKLVGAGWVREDEIFEHIAATAHEIGLDKGEIRPTIQSGLEAGKKKPRVMPQDNFPEVDQAEAKLASLRMARSMMRKRA